MQVVVRDLDPQLPLPGVPALDGIADASVEPRRFQRNVILSMAGAALLLASIGLYGVVSQSMAERT